MNDKQNNSTDDWSTWRNHVLAELQRQNDNIEALRDKIDANEKARQDEKTSVKIDITQLQTKVWAICAAISIVIGLIMKYV